MEEENTCLNEDCVNLMRRINLQEFNCIITDPPYDVDFQNKIDALVEERGLPKYQYVEMTHEYELISKLFHRVLKNNSYCIIFCSDMQIKPWISCMEKMGFVFIQSLIWQKESGVFNMSIYATTITHETALIFRKGKPSALNPSDAGKGSILKFKRVKENRFHPAQKPVELLKYIINLYTKPGDFVFDAYAGSGSTLKACKEMNRKFLGCELIKEYCDRINKELKNHAPVTTTRQRQLN